jgi:hypothetical protein
MPPAGFKPTIPAREWPQTHALHGAATGMGLLYEYIILTKIFNNIPGNKAYALLRLAPRTFVYIKLPDGLAISIVMTQNLIFYLLC